MKAIISFVCKVILGFIFFMFCMWVNTSVVNAQNVVKQGNTFVQGKTKGEAKKTAYTFKTSDGKEYPIYLSVNGKAFIIRVSKNGKEYKQYLPEVTKQLSK